jgi:precorrin-2 C20-methyltransferase/precorrin-3B C17-methyltransferase
MAGTLYGVGLGPGDPELVTVKAVRLIAAADVVAYHSARHGRSVARLIAEPYLRGDQIEEQLVYPVTTETIDHPGGYEGAIEEFYQQAAARLIAHLDAGRDVVLLAEGDPLFYSSYMHMHKRIDGRYATSIVPGVTSVSAASAALAMPLTEGNDVLTVLPGTMAQEQLTERLMTTDAAAIMKISRSYAEVQQALKGKPRLNRRIYVERASGDKQIIQPAGAVDLSACQATRRGSSSRPGGGGRPRHRAPPLGASSESAASTGQPGPAGRDQPDPAGARRYYRRQRHT